MLRSLFFYHAFSRNNFAHALARYTAFPRIDSSYMLYACYRLGLYQTVAQTPLYIGKNWRGGFSRAVSLAACGRHDDAEAQVHAWFTYSRTAEQQANLAGCLAPFHSQLAHEIFKNTSAPIPFQAAVLSRIEEKESALEYLEHYFITPPDEFNPESYLLLSNALETVSSQKKMVFLNQFLNTSGVLPLRLVDESLPPSPMNVELIEQSEPLRGPLVSVLMTAYNSEERIVPAIKSILSQSYRDLELIVVDDASEDRTGDVVRSLASQDSRVRYVRLPINVGTYVAKSIGLKYAMGEFVTCHDSDDWAHSVKIERQIAPLLKNKRIVATTSHFLRMTESGEYYARQVYPLMRLNSSSVLFRREKVLEHAGGWDLVRTGADSEFLARLKLVFGPKSVCGIREPLTLGAHRPNSLMTAVETGYSTVGMSPTRLSYWESWCYWHIDEIRSGRKPKIDIDLKAPRKYAAPENICVPLSEIENCIDSVCSQL